MTVRAFLIGTAKIATAIVGSIIALSLIGWGIYAYKAHSEAEANEPLEHQRVWPAITAAALDKSSFSLATSWRDGRMYYRWALAGYPSAIAAAYEQSATSYKTTPDFTVVFLDENGFKLFEYKIPPDELVRIIGENGNPSGFSARGDTFVSADQYRRAKAWDIVWRL
jgi:hypothetical protein